MSTSTLRLPFATDPRYLPVQAPFGVLPGACWIEVGVARLHVRFGPWSVTTRLDNVVGVERTGPYRWYRTAGPARLGVTDLGLTFATTGRAGVLLTFAERVHGVLPVGPLTHAELTVTPADPDALVDALRARVPALARG